MVAGWLTAVGCGTEGAVPGDGAPGDIPGGMPGMPRLGAHGLNFYHLATSTASSITTPIMATQSSGSTIVVGVGRGDNTKFTLPTDNKANTPYQQQGQVQAYIPLYPESGTAVYAFTSAKGGPDFRVSTTNGTNTKGQYDEVTLAAVEVIDGRRIQAFEWNEPTSAPVTSKSITTTGPATLIAFWWGDGYFYNPPLSQAATPNNGFTVIESNTQELNSFVQCTVAAKNVAAAGTYNVTWTATPAQGAQLWLIAVQ
ncbi:MAG TPA: hypothetical protein VHN14_06325 [Kofleriaceae bacterium]|jgi:hypothetical protein|nr:hypothetical protein [Kofleriaceae bacterium]